MKKQYNFDYAFCRATVTFNIDTDVFTPEVAKATLQFYTWDYDEEADPVEEVLKKYALQAIETATSESLNTDGVKIIFEKFEGFCNVDGSNGIELVHVEEYEFNEEDLTLKVEELPA